MRYLQISEKTQIYERFKDNINVFCQFFISPNARRNAELKYCLKKNVENQHITNIYLLNERIYTPSELGIMSNKIIQIDTKQRLKYSHVFKYINDNQITGYNTLINLDIFFDDSLKNLYISGIHLHKTAFALLRYEYNNIDISLSRLFGPRSDSQDTWIIHSNFVVKEPAFNFQFGMPGCDNKMIYLLNVLGFKISNDPFFIKTYHYHATQERSYTAKDRIPEPWGVVIPTNIKPEDCVCGLGIHLKEKLNFNDNSKLYDYILSKGDAPFVIPRIAGIENNIAFIGRLMQSGMNPNIVSYLDKIIKPMKTNAGIRLPDMNSVIQYSQLYLKAFVNCETYAAWENYCNYYHGIKQSHDFITTTFVKPQVWTAVFDIYHYIYNTPWTHALRGKRILIISAFESSIQPKIAIREKIYGVDLFPECEIITIKPPQTQGTEPSDDFLTELNRFTAKLDAIKDTYDIALVSCGGYGNLVCNHIFESGKSAIYVGGVLQMYFGILGSRWFKDRADILRMFMNEHWSRPRECERPQGHEAVEGSCYW